VLAETFWGATIDLGANSIICELDNLRSLSIIALCVI